MFKWTVEASADAMATPKVVWGIWTNVNRWPEWDSALEWSHIDGKFRVGARGEIKPKEWPVSYFTVTVVEPLKRYHDISNVSFATVEFAHFLTPAGPGHVKITHQVTVEGLFAPFLKFTLGKALKQGLPHAVKAIAELAERREAESND